MFKDRHSLRLKSRGDEVSSLPQTTQIFMTIVKKRIISMFYDDLLNFIDSTHYYY